MNKFMFVNIFKLSFLSCMLLVSVLQPSYGQTGNKVVVIPLGSDGPKLKGGFDDDQTRVPSTDFAGSSTVQVGHWLGLNFRIIAEAGGEGANDGRLEVSVDGGPYGTVCDDFFDDNNNAARVICRVMGYSDGVLRESADTTDGTGSILIDDFMCPNNARTFLDCGVREFGANNCAHIEDVGVTCIE